MHTSQRYKTHSYTKIYIMSGETTHLYKQTDIVGDKAKRGISKRR